MVGKEAKKRRFNIMTHSPFKEVVITGVGVTTPLENGKGTDEFWYALCRGVNAIKPISEPFALGHKCAVAGKVGDFQRFLDASWTGHDRCAKLFALACQHALMDSKVDRHLIPNMGIIAGTILGGIISGEQYMRELSKPEKAAALLKQYCLASTADAIKNRYSLRGPAGSVSTACCSGADAIKIAATQIRNGRADIMIAGGADVFSEFAFRGFSALNALTTDGKVRPFDKDRKGLALSEGAGVIILEEKKHAQDRGARIYCSLASFASSADACHMVRPNPDGEGLSRSIQNALSSIADVDGDIDYICAHGTGTQYNDSMEAKAIKRVFGKKTSTISVSSIKSMIGHTLGAASAIEAICCVKAMEKSTIPPTINLEKYDPECELQHVAKKALIKNINMCMSLSAGFGGQNTALVFKKHN